MHLLVQSFIMFHYNIQNMSAEDIIADIECNDYFEPELHAQVVALVKEVYDDLAVTLAI